ncbi:Putative uncharacterized protein [Taphrina deformans PYCC 5710]|uniref:Endonuclease/exonuclease/phosphatase domain-containing protein n=1 Tax=Taphrina deformans (strain PYCC 5710 / ATCC 11124 / CBS 356.35 / IMI 108563 / JCM 9778 / NBRC 8474) TaxID=1097556 RepID=R4XB02_TAPDE|nr:Putative uncharacterized protein [Taphrina deformans PYCC 5710]|eukprot:CCG83003.1 Putative uncharacterized protein [Taphrina deformans PYCC 5710]
MCLQEVGTDMLDPCLQKFFSEHGYKFAFHAGEGKLHGVMVVYRQRRFELLHKRTINYDHARDEDAHGIPDHRDPLPKSNNVGLVCVMKDLVSNMNFIIGTTHLFWHPRGTYERARQLQLLVALLVQVSQELEIRSRIILAGDLNTEPLDPTYLALTQRPYMIDPLGCRIMQESSSQIAADDEDTHADPTSFEPSDAGASTEKKWKQRIDRLSGGPQFRSLYAEHYHAIDPGNCGSQGEPTCTNFANVYRGTLDYLLTPVESNITCNALLQMPDLTLLSQGQPQEGQFPSDHFALGCEVTLE